MGVPMELLVLNSTTGTLAGGAATVIPLAANVPKLLIKTIRVTADNTTDTFEVEILTLPENGRVEYASLPMTGELYDTLELPYVCATADNQLYLRITPAVDMAFAIEIRAIKLK